MRIAFQSRVNIAILSMIVVAGCANTGTTSLRTEPSPPGITVQDTAVAHAAAENAALAAANAQNAQGKAEQAQHRAESARDQAVAAQEAATEAIALHDASLTASDQIQIVRYIGGNARDWPNSINGSNKLDPNAGFSDLYSRFILISGDERIGAGPSDDMTTYRNYRAERPGWLARIFTERERSIVAVAKISLLNPSLEMTVPLYSVSYNSGGKGGEAWATAMTASYVRSPLFRVTANSRFAVDVSTDTSNATQSSGFSTAITALTSAVQLVAPEAGLLTTLSKDSTRDRANALDSAISKLLSYSVSEHIEFGRMINTWQPGAAIRFDGCAPFVRVEAPDDSAATAQPVDPGSPNCANDLDLDGQKNHYVGNWRLVLTCPQFSVFSPRTICKSRGEFEDIATPSARSDIGMKIAGAVQDSLVLEEPLGENATVRSLIRGSDFFTAFIAAQNRDAEKYGMFCASTMDVLRQAGLTGLDSALGLRATLRLMPEFVADSGNAALTANCRTLMSYYGVALQ